MSIPRTGPVSPKHVIVSEIVAVTSAMRKNSRWALSSHRTLTAGDSALARDLGLRKSSSPSPANDSTRRVTRESDLMVGFLEVKRIVRDVEDIKLIPLPTLLSPFFAIIRSSLSTGPITSAALASLHTFFVSGIISSNSIQLDIAMTELSNAVSRCKFEASDSSGDEVVLLRIMTIIQDVMCSPTVGLALGDVDVCEMLETVLTTCCQMRLSETLRRSAENTMHALVRTMFSKLHHLDPATEEAKLISTDEEVQEGEIKFSVAQSAAVAEAALEADPKSDALEIEAPEEKLASPISTVGNALPVKPDFGLPAIIELLRVLVNILDPNDQVHTDSTRLTALAILNTAFEVSGQRMSDYKSLFTLIVDSGCKFLFQLARSENLAVLHLALRTISTVFETSRKYLKLQQELFLVFSIDRLAPPPSQALRKNQQALVSTVSSRSASPARLGTPDSGAEEKPSTPVRPTALPAKGETRDLILETLSQIARHPSFMVDLYTNYDCDVNCDNLFERLVDFLTRGVYSSHYIGGLEAQQENSQYICLDLLLAFVGSMVERAEDNHEEWPENTVSTEELKANKSRKEMVIMGANRFNAKPKAGLALLEEYGLIYADLSPEVSKAQSLAKFLKSCSRLDKRLLGDFISKPDNIQTLEAFIRLFDFKDKPIMEAMREILEAFRLPGESQQISRITETFAAIYYQSGQKEIKSEDAVYVLAYSVIMLNTDLHSPSVRKRMAIEDYKRNLRGVNKSDTKDGAKSDTEDNNDFPEEYLQNIFDSIRKREIIMPEEHTGQLGFEYAWKELLARSRLSGDLIMCNSSLYDKDMFKAVWKPVISAITYAFISFDDDAMIQRAITGFRQCATLAGRFEMPDVFDFIVISLSQATSLLSDDLPTQVPNYPVVDIEGQPITVSSLSVRFGTNFKGQLAAVVLFNIVNGHGNALREGWTQIFEMFQNLFLHSVLPKRMLQMEDFLGGVSMIPLRGNQPESSGTRHEGGGGLLSALSSYLMTPYGTSGEQSVPDATDADVESTLCTMDCIASCRLDELYAEIMTLDLEPLVAAVKALEALAHERTVARLKLDSDEHTGDVNTPSYVVPYDPASVFLLETMLSIARHTPQHIEDLWPVIFEHLRSLLSTPEQYSILLIERAIVGLLRMCLLLAPQSSLRDQIYISLDLIASLPSAVVNGSAELIVSGVSLIVQTYPQVVKSQTEWNLVFAVIRLTLLNPEAAKLSFEFVAKLAKEGPEESVTLDNFGSLITVLDEFATLAGITAEAQLKGRRSKVPTVADSPVVQRGHASIELIFQLKRYVLPLSESNHLSKHKAWRQLSLHLLTSLARQSANAAREVRHTAVGNLQRFLLGPQLALDEKDHSHIEEVFQRLLFPLLDDLLKPQIFQRDPIGMPETRLRASALLCKAFMHFEIRDAGQPRHDIRLLWISILDLLDRLMNDDRTNQLAEAIPESLKNVVLVLSTADILVPPSADDTRDEQQKTFWTATHERLERFLPGFLGEVIAIPDVPPTPSTAGGIPTEEPGVVQAPPTIVEE